MKKFLMLSLIVVVIIQLFVPVYMIIGHYDVLRTGTEYKFKVNPVDPYDAFRGRYVSLSYRGIFTNENRKGKYGIIQNGDDGFANIIEIVDQKPNDKDYVKSRNKSYFNMPIDRYYMEEKLAPKAELLTRQRDPNKITYVTAKVKKGTIVISGLFIDDIAIEEIIKNESK